MAGGIEIRWIVLCSDGRHVTICRHSDPDENDIEHARSGLAAAGLSGWLAVLKGGYYTRSKGELFMVLPLSDDPGSWDHAVATFMAIRKENTQAA